MLHPNEVPKEKLLKLLKFLYESEKKDKETTRKIEALESQIKRQIT